jgi:hypothetical protein
MHEIVGGSTLMYIACSDGVVQSQPQRVPKLALGSESALASGHCGRDSIPSRPETSFRSTEILWGIARQGEVRISQEVK